ncbi:MAG: sugar ABC transporter permease [candidate division KSB1 bacterium]|nr:sugar ABC transporter permease [candidate division KSB1 bacterium]MDZ7334719.1 sugar ABC transporter permease [candidate division KSB1 bacterium]MDZ7356223.1 sugar ABC transporter permease [candidate division KSB1 bacterium]MDZ7400366.1 sugar ABC transporter permease [candidate division KSB1 bacterium]
MNKKSNTFLIMKKNRSLIYLALLPTFALLAIFNYWPVYSALKHAFYQWDPGGVHRFIGVANFVRLAQDGIFWKSLHNLLIIILINSTVKIAIPLVVAVLIFHLAAEKIRYLYRVLFVIPMVVPTMVTILIWSYIYSDTGILSELLRAVGLDRYDRAWLGSPQTALASVVGVGFPFVSGLALLVFYAGLMNLPESIFDAATIEGATQWQLFSKIELPLLLRQVRVILVLTVLGSVQGYELFLILTRGGPGYETMVPGLWMYLTGFSFNEMGYACCIGFVMFLFMLLITITNLKFIQPRD